jgi:hypothetical protein
VAVVAGVDRDAVTAQLKQAYGRLRGIEAAARAIAVPEFGDRLERIIDIGRDILGEIERDPREATRARRFLNLYLDSAEKVTMEYARTHRHLRSRPLEQNFRSCSSTEQTFRRSTRNCGSAGSGLEISLLSASTRRRELKERRGDDAQHRAKDRSRPAPRHRLASAARATEAATVKPTRRIRNAMNKSGLPTAARSLLRHLRPDGGHDRRGARACQKRTPVGRAGPQRDGIDAQGFAIDDLDPSKRGFLSRLLGRARRSRAPAVQ